MEMPRKLKTALDETRMLMMGSQILFGFQLIVMAGWHRRRFIGFPAPARTRRRCCVSARTWPLLVRLRNAALIGTRTQAAVSPCIGSRNGAGTGLEGSMRVAEVMNRHVQLASPEDSLQDVAKRMVSDDIGFHAGRGE